MCLLSYFPSDIEPTADHLLNGSRINQDGYGWCVATPSKLIIFRSLIAEIAIERFIETRKQHMDMPAMFHSRWGTSGIDGTYNCHPFIVGTDHRTVIAHNGVLSAGHKDDPRCDTRIFAETQMPRMFHRFDKPTAVTALERFLGHGNKIVAITINPRYRNNAYIFNEDQGVWSSDGAWHSNYDYLGRRQTFAWTDDDGTQTEYDATGYWVKEPNSNVWKFHRYASYANSDSTHTIVKNVVSSSTVYANSNMALARTRYYGSCRHCGACSAVAYRIGRCMVCYACTRCGDPGSPCECGWGSSVDESEWEEWLRNSTHPNALTQREDYHGWEDMAR